MVYVAVFECETFLISHLSSVYYVTQSSDLSLLSLSLLPSISLFTTSLFSHHRSKVNVRPALANKENDKRKVGDLPTIPQEDEPDPEPTPQDS